MPEAKSVKLKGFTKQNLVLVANFLGVEPKYFSFCLEKVGWLWLKDSLSKR